MKRLWLLVGLTFLLFLSAGCKSSDLATKQGEQEISDSPFISQTPLSGNSIQPSPYPEAEKTVEATSLSSSQPYPEAIDETAKATSSEAVSTASPTPVDLAMRATNPDQFVLASGGYQLVEFFAFWCPTCRSMAPVLKKLENQFAGKVQFIYLDIDDPKTNPYKQSLGYLYQPHFFLIDGQGNIIKQWVGYVEEEELTAVLGSLQ